MNSFNVVIASFILSLILPLSAFAQEERTVNPGEDPNEAMPTSATESSVSAVGICNECISRMYGATGRGSRLGDDTTYRPGGKNTEAGVGSGTGETLEGTR